MRAFHIEQAWTENVATAEGRVQHQRVHAAGSEVRRGVRTVTGAIDRMQNIARRFLHETDLDRLRGYEGEAASLYCGVFGHALLVADDTLAFRGRSRRPPTDPVNALLSFIYTLLVHDCRGALEGVGLDPAAGFLHRLRPGRPSLALDLMGELRAPLADWLALSMLNRRELGPADFRVMEKPMGPT